MTPSFDCVLVANRGEIAERIMFTLGRLGIASAAVYSDADRGAGHVLMADRAVRIGPAPSSQSYLRADAIIEAALSVGADAIHPGYGFLSENAAFARACAAAGIVFIGPPGDAIEMMGDKITAKQTVSAAGVPVVPGIARAGLSDADLLAAAEQIGFPVLIKPSAGGGGKGMRRVEDAALLAEAIASARREAANAFGDDTLFMERFVARPRHIEIQVLLDTHGNAVHLGERECSLQRRHQKIVEEAPSPLLTAHRRAEMGARAIAAAQACGYTNAGTVEFIVSGDRPDEFFFMEMNTRLQVEHPVTELVWGVDLVEQQIRVAAGEVLGFGQDELVARGHAIEARLAAEDPSNGFIPSPGTVRALALPGSHRPQHLADGLVRVDAGVRSGQEIGTHYDPMIAKVIAFGDDRAAALATLDAALGATTIMGIATNTGFVRRLLREPEVRAGDLDTGLVERRADALAAASRPGDAVIIAAAIAALDSQPSVLADGDPWHRRDGWRLGTAAWSRWRARERFAQRDLRVALRGDDLAREAIVDDGITHHVVTRFEPNSITATEPGVRRLSLSVAGERISVDVLRDDDTIWVVSGGETWAFVEEGLAGENHRSSTERSGVLRSPMPGSVVSLAVAAGESVTADQAVVMIEAMKMEHTLRAPFDGTVAAVRVAVGDQVALGAELVEIEPLSPVDPTDPNA